MSFHLADNIAIGNGALGGVILALSSASLMYLTGKVTGISGISSGLILSGGEDWQVVYITGLVAAGVILHHYNPSVFGSPERISVIEVVLGAFFVGLGTKLASGCTSGHGLVGLARLSPRSLTAVLTFMGVGALAASYRHWLLSALPPSIRLDMLDGLLWLQYPSNLLPLACIFLSALLYHRTSPGAQEGGVLRKSSPLTLSLVGASCALVFGLGLGVAGMLDVHRVRGFLAPFHASGWDPSLAAVMGSGMLLNLVAFQRIKAGEVSCIATGQSVSQRLVLGPVGPNLNVNFSLLLGSALFGLGWGLTGVCPGPGWVSLYHQSVVGGSYVFYLPAMLLGMLAAEIAGK